MPSRNKRRQNSLTPEQYADFKERKQIRYLQSKQGKLDEEMLKGDLEFRKEVEKIEIEQRKLKLAETPQHKLKPTTDVQEKVVTIDEAIARLKQTCSSSKAS